jgi:hypothetical protein
MSPDEIVAAATGKCYLQCLYQCCRMNASGTGHSPRTVTLFLRLSGTTMESATEDVLTEAGISFRKTKSAERVVGFDQAPDFINYSGTNSIHRW